MRCRAQAAGMLDQRMEAASVEQLPGGEKSFLSVSRNRVLNILD